VPALTYAGDCEGLSSVEDFFLSPKNFLKAAPAPIAARSHIFARPINIGRNYLAKNLVFTAASSLAQY
jgi:hypothetical protein